MWFIVYGEKRCLETRTERKNAIFWLAASIGYRNFLGLLFAMGCEDREVPEVTWHTFSIIQSHLLQKTSDSSI